MVKVKSNIKLPVRYLPSLKEIKDAAKQVKMLMKSRRLYKKASITRVNQYLLTRVNQVNMSKMLNESIIFLL